MQDWANRIGLTLQFISLWLVTPEIIGQARMTQAADYLRDVNARKQAQAQKRLQRTVKMVKDPGWVGLLMLFVVIGLEQAFFTFARQGSGHHGHTAARIPFSLSNLAVVTIGNGAVALLALAFLASYHLVISWARGALRLLLDAGARTPHRFLLTGASLFSVGFVVLLCATWLPK